MPTVIVNDVEVEVGPKDNVIQVRDARESKFLTTAGTMS